VSGSIAAHRFSNDLRYRPEDHPNQTQLTPAYVLEPVRDALGGIELDPCTLPDNPCSADRWYSPPQDGAELPWDAATIYVNPPYGKARERWVQRCTQAAADGSRVVLLIPAHTDTRTFHAAAETTSHIVFVRGRVKFGVLRPNRRQVAASHPSALLCWNLPNVDALAHLGLVFR
jgi:DNA N-6-adenine-methyltransferase (Dam)